MKSSKPDRILYYFRKEWKILLVVTVTGIVYNVGLTFTPWFEGQMVQYLCDILSGNRLAADMLVLVLAYVIVVGCVQLVRFFKRLYVRKFANRISREMKMTLYRHLLYERNADNENTGDLMTKIISDADACAEGMRKFTTEVFDTGVVMIAYLVMLLCYDVKLTLLCMIFPPIAYVLAEKLKKTVTRYTAAGRESSAKLNSATLERIRNAVTYRIYGLEEERNREYEKDLTDYEQKAVRANVWENAMQPLYQIISMGGTVLIFVFGSRNVLGTGWTAWNIAAFTAYFSCYQKLAVKSSKAAKLFNAVQKAQVSWQRIQPYLKEKERHENPETDVYELDVNGVSFHLGDGTDLFSDVSFSAHKGQIIGITGEIACGKSVLGKILIGELPFEGSVMFDGQKISCQGNKDITCVGYLGHSPQLFNGTLKDNICMGKEGTLIDVLRDVCLEEDLASFPDGVDTVIGESGTMISGGQQARIGLARTLYHPKPVLVLDDPFSAVDRQTEKQIFEHLKDRYRDRIIILISHRLSLFPYLDGVLWMENGKAVFSTHTELMETEADYRKLYEAQQEVKS